MKTDVEERLVRAMTEQLKAPLLQISLSAELSQSDNSFNSYDDIKNIADMALRMLDGYLLGFDLQGEGALDLEPVSLSSTLTDTAHILEPAAKRKGCDLSVSLKGKYGPAMANREGLETALVLIGNSLIEGRGGEHGKRREVVLGAHRSSRGLVTGIFDNQPGLSSDVLRRGRALFGSAKQTMPTAISGNGAGVFVADRLFTVMDTTLRVARHSKLTGLAATLHPSRQLRLV